MPRHTAALLASTVLGLALGAVGSEAAAQVAPPTGSVVKVRSSIWKGHRTFEVVDHRAPDSLVLRRRLSRNDVQDVTMSQRAMREILLREPRNRAQGLRYGAATGVVLGAVNGLVLGLLTNAIAGGGAYYTITGPGVHPLWVEIPVGAALGAVVGGALGAAFPPPRWRRL